MTRANLIRLLLLVSILLVFGQTITHDFVDWDDGVLVYTNHNIAKPTLIGLAHHWNPLNPDSHYMYNPMVFSLWWVIAHAAQIDSPDLLGSTVNPYLFHAANLIMHWLCACVVFEILRRLKLRDWPAAAGALLFAIHPLQTEVVAWVSSMKDLLSGFFALLAIWRYIAAVEAGGKARQREYWISTLCFAAALLSKPSTVILPVIVGVIDLITYRRSWKTVALWTAPWYAMALVITFIAAKIQLIEPHVGGPLWARPLIAGDSLAFYLAKLFLPIYLQFDYGRSPNAIMHNPYFHYPLYWTWIFPLALAVILWRSKCKPLILAALIFAIGLLPVLGLKMFAYQYYTTVADRYVYLSMLGASLAAAWFLGLYKNRFIPIAASVLLVLLGFLSFVQAQKWVDTNTLYTTLLNPHRSAHETTMGQYQDFMAYPLLRDAARAHQIGNFAEEQKDLQERLALKEKAMYYFRKGIANDPLEGNCYDFLAKDLVELHRIPEAIATVKEWMKYDPLMDPGSREAPGQLQGMLGTLYIKNRQYPEAIESLNKSLAEKDDPEVQKTLTTVEKLLKQNESSQKAMPPTTK